MKFVRNRFLVAALSALVSLPAAAAEEQKGMNFTGWTDRSGVKWGSGVQDYIFGDGEIVSESVAKLQEAMTKFKAHPGTIVVLNSPGGNVEAGLEMGRMIRKAKMNTTVGTLNPTYIGLSPNLEPQMVPFTPLPIAPPFPGYCYSSCTLMLLGGVVRSVSSASDYGVHRFSYVKAPEDVADDAQKETAGILAYVEEMGVSGEFMTEMVKKGSDDVTHLTEARLAELHVITPNWTTNWKYTIVSRSRSLYLRADTVDRWGEHQLSFYCPYDDKAKASGAYLFLDALLAPSGRVDPDEFVKNVKGYALELDQGSLPLTPQDIWVQAVVAPQSHRIGVSIKLTRTLVGYIESARHIGVAFLADTGEVSLLQFIATIDPQILREYVEQCPLPQLTPAAAPATPAPSTPAPAPKPPAPVVPSPKPPAAPASQSGPSKPTPGTGANPAPAPAKP
jgi:hypothetical protein